MRYPRLRDFPVKCDELITTGLSDQETITVLRTIQKKLHQARPIA